MSPLSAALVKGRLCQLCKDSAHPRTQSHRAYYALHEAKKFTTRSVLLIPWSAFSRPPALGASASRFCSRFVWPLDVGRGRVWPSRGGCLSRERVVPAPDATFAEPHPLPTTGSARLPSTSSCPFPTTPKPPIQAHPAAVASPGRRLRPGRARLLCRRNEMPEIAVDEQEDASELLGNVSRLF